MMVLLNIVATVFIVQSETATPRQKALQLIIVWVVPLVGAIIIIAVLKATGQERERSFDSGSSTTSWMPGMGPESDHSHRGGYGEGSGDAGHGGDAGSGGH
jgi:hypothetical protein